MAIPEPDKIWPKLEEIGVDEVRKRIAMGVYAANKLPVIEEWIRRTEIEMEKQGQDDDDKKDSPSGESASLYDRFIATCKNNKTVVVILLLAVLIIGLGKISAAISNIMDFGEKISTPETSIDHGSADAANQVETAEGETTKSVEYPVVGQSEIADSQPALRTTPETERRTLSIEQVETFVKSQTALIFDVKPSSITLDTRFEDIESPEDKAILPGLGVVELVVEVETNLGCRISDDIAERITSVNDAVLAVMSCE
jgi:acyl carrier protein